MESSTSPVRIAVMTGTVFETMGEIDGLSDEVEVPFLVGGGCGKMEQWPLSVGFGAPRPRSQDEPGMSRREIITVRSDATKIGVVNSAVASIRAQSERPPFVTSMEGTSVSPVSSAQLAWMC